jgi:hypothetical protein
MGELFKWIPRFAHELIAEINNTLVPKLDYLWKHVGHHKALLTMPRVKIVDDYIFKTNFHVANEKLYF